MSQHRSEISHLQALFANRIITRRDFMGRAAALGLTTALATSLAGQAAKAATPKKGGVMKLAMGHGSMADTCDPATIENGGASRDSFAFEAAITDSPTRLH